jgi:hypothetical protein
MHTEMIWPSHEWSLARPCTRRDRGRYSVAAFIVVATIMPAAYLR